jgi:hypothetical protein
MTHGRLFSIPSGLRVGTISLNDGHLRKSRNSRSRTQPILLAPSLPPFTTVLPLHSVLFEHMIWIIDIMTSMVLQPSLGPWPLLDFRNLFYIDGRNPWTISSLQGLYLHAGQHKENKRTETSPFWAESEPTIPMFVLAKTVHALDRAATVIGYDLNHCR